MYEKVNKIEQNPDLYYRKALTSLDNKDSPDDMGVLWPIFYTKKIYEDAFLKKINNSKGI